MSIKLFDKHYQLTPGITSQSTLLSTLFPDNKGQYMNKCYNFDFEDDMKDDWEILFVLLIQGRLRNEDDISNQNLRNEVRRKILGSIFFLNYFDFKSVLPYYIKMIRSGSFTVEELLEFYPIIKESNILSKIVHLYFISINCEELKSDVQITFNRFKDMSVQEKVFDDLIPRFVAIKDIDFPNISYIDFPEKVDSHITIEDFMLALDPSYPQDMHGRTIDDVFGTMVLHDFLFPNYLYQKHKFKPIFDAISGSANIYLSVDSEVMDWKIIVPLCLLSYKPDNKTLKDNDGKLLLNIGTLYDISGKTLIKINDRFFLIKRDVTQEYIFGDVIREF